MDWDLHEQSVNLELANQHDGDPCTLYVFKNRIELQSGLER